MKIKQLWVDMDGVLFDFDDYYKSLYGITPEEAEKDKRFYPLFLDFIQKQSFAKLKLLPHAQDAINRINKIAEAGHIKVQILSSTANEEIYEEVARQKRISLQAHNIHWNPIFVPGGVKKAQYANPDSLLIDDTMKVITAFKNAGGRTIHHHDWITTMQILSMYV